MVKLFRNAFQKCLGGKYNHIFFTNLQNVCKDGDKLYQTFIQYEKAMNIIQNPKELALTESHLSHIYDTIINLSISTFSKQNFDFCWNNSLRIPSIIPNHRVTLHKYVSNK